MGTFIDVNEFSITLAAFSRLLYMEIRSVLHQKELAVAVTQI